MTTDLRSCMVRRDATLLDAMLSLEVSGSQIVLITDADDQLIGVLTDGDIRRALLGGAALADAVGDHANADYFAIGEESGRADVLELMQARQIAQVPVVGPAGRVVGLHLLHELLAITQRPNWAVVMAGGRGSRLGLLTETLPKPMLPVAGRPILERIVLHLVGSGIRRIFLSVNYRGEVIEAHFGDGAQFGSDIRYLREAEPLGTAGSLALLPRGADGPAHPVYVMNGDLVTQANVGQLIDFHERGDQAVTMAVRRYYNQVPFGCVDVDGDRLVGFVEKPTTAQFVNAGMYVLDPAWIDLIPPGQAVAMPDLVLRIREAGGTARVFEIEDDWTDIGRRDQLEQARRGE